MNTGQENNYSIEFSSVYTFQHVHCPLHDSRWLVIEKFKRVMATK